MYFYLIPRRNNDSELPTQPKDERKHQNDDWASVCEYFWSEPLFLPECVLFHRGHYLYFILPHLQKAYACKLQR